MKIYVKDATFAYSCVIRMYMQYLPKSIEKGFNYLSLSLKRDVQNAVHVKWHVLTKPLLLTCRTIGGWMKTMILISIHTLQKGESRC